MIRPSCHINSSPVAVAIAIMISNLASLKSHAKKTLRRTDPASDAVVAAAHSRGLDAAGADNERLTAPRPYRRLVMLGGAGVPGMSGGGGQEYSCARLSITVA